MEKNSAINAQVLEWQLIELAIVGRSFLCLYATSARRLYVIDVPGLSQVAGYNGMPPPRAIANSRSGTLVIRHRTESNSATGISIYQVVIYRSLTDRLPTATNPNRGRQSVSMSGLPCGR